MRNVKCPDDGLSSLLFISSKLRRSFEASKLRTRFEEGRKAVRVVDTATETTGYKSGALPLICYNHRTASRFVLLTKYYPCD